MLLTLIIKLFLESNVEDMIQNVEDSLVLNPIEDDDGLLALLTAERIWFKCNLYLRFIPPINICNIWIDLRPFLKCKEGPFSRSWRSPRSNNLEIQKDENSKPKLVKTR